jgi:hypothetical protein
LVESPLQFVQVGVQMPERQLMVRAHDGTLEEAPDINYGVGVNQHLINGAPLEEATERRALDHSMAFEYEP